MKNNTNKFAELFSGKTILEIEQLRQIRAGEEGGGATKTKGGTYVANEPHGCFDDSCNDYACEGCGGTGPYC